MWIDLIDCQLECVIYHSRNKLSQQGAGLLEARVRVDLDQPHLHTTVNKEVEPVYFEADLSLSKIELPLNRTHCDPDGLLHLLDHLLAELIFALLLQDLVELLKRHLVSELVLLVLVTLFLDRIICQMYVHVV